jgi:hypothetical protein
LSASPIRGGGDDFFEQAADATAVSLPQAQRLTVEGQGHVVDPKSLAPVLERFSGNEAAAAQ